jgi:hypothetical protein|eukprot:SAG25_NODE_1222_length_3569_cov_3.378963_2_plen_105_part_00
MIGAWQGAPRVEATLHVDKAGAVLYAMLFANLSTSPHSTAAMALLGQGWEKTGMSTLFYTDTRHSKLAIYKKTFAVPDSFALDQAEAGFAGLFVAWTSDGHTTL